MEKTCRTCEHWQVTGSGKYDKEMFPGSWGTERRNTENILCKCRYWTDDAPMADAVLWRHANEKCLNWDQASDIIDECVLCGALLFEYDRPGKDRKTRFWWDGDNDCEHEGEHYHGKDPWSCGMCQGAGWVIVGTNQRMVQCDACHGKGTVD